MLFLSEKNALKENKYLTDLKLGKLHCFTLKTRPKYKLQFTLLRYFSTVFKLVPRLAARKDKGAGCPSWQEFVGKHHGHHFPLRCLRSAKCQSSWHYDWQQDWVACTNTGEMKYLSWDSTPLKIYLVALQTNTCDRDTQRWELFFFFLMKCPLQFYMRVPLPGGFETRGM